MPANTVDVVRRWRSIVVALAVEALRLDVDSSLCYILAEHLRQTRERLDATQQALVTPLTVGRWRTDIAREYIEDIEIEPHLRRLSSTSSFAARSIFNRVLNLDIDTLDDLAREVSLDELEPEIARILKGGQTGRVVVNLKD